jgi:hypothetical protein
MRNKNKLLTAALVFASVLPMTSCAKTLDATCYGLNSYFRSKVYGDTIFKADVTVNNGKIQSASIEETYSPNVWARVSEDDAKNKLGEDNYLEVTDATLEDGTKGTLYYAKYINVNGQDWTGIVREEDDESKNYRVNVHHENIRYYTSDDSTDAGFDLLTYLNTSDSGTYKLGGFANTYFNDVNNGNIKILKDTSTDETEPVKLEDSGIAPYFPSDKKLRNENSTYASWKTSTEKFCEYLKGKALNFKEYVKDEDEEKHYTLKDDDGVWYYNPTLSNSASEDPDTLTKIEKDQNNWEVITDCKKTDISNDELIAYFSAFNQAFASVEYDSIA